MEYERAILDTACFYWGPLSDGQTSYLLKDAVQGTYLARETNKYAAGQSGFDIVVKIPGGIAKLPVLRRDGLLSLNFGDHSQPRAVTLYGLIKKLVQITKADSSVLRLVIRNVDLEVSIQVLEPCKRMSSLKAHCRRVLRLKYDVETIGGLPLPRQLKRYLTAVY